MGSSSQLPKLRAARQESIIQRRTRNKREE